MTKLPLEDFRSDGTGEHALVEKSESLEDVRGDLGVGHDFHGRTGVAVKSPAVDGRGRESVSEDRAKVERGVVQKVLGQANVLGLIWRDGFDGWTVEAQDGGSRVMQKNWRV